MNKVLIVIMLTIVLNNISGMKIESIMNQRNSNESIINQNWNIITLTQQNNVQPTRPTKKQKCDVSCNRCSAKYRCESELKIHKNRIHKKYPNLNCNYLKCPRKVDPTCRWLYQQWVSQGQFIRHLEKHHKDMLEKCSKKS